MESAQFASVAQYLSPLASIPTAMTASSTIYVVVPVLDYRELYRAMWINLFVRYRTNGVWGPLLRCSPWSRSASQTTRAAQHATMKWT
jgi:hypothetical protein